MLSDTHFHILHVPQGFRLRGALLWLILVVFAITGLLVVHESIMLAGMAWSVALLLGAALVLTDYLKQWANQPLSNIALETLTTNSPISITEAQDEEFPTWKLHRLLGYGNSYADTLPNGQPFRIRRTGLHSMELTINGEPPILFRYERVAHLVYSDNKAHLLIDGMNYI